MSIMRYSVDGQEVYSVEPDDRGSVDEGGPYCDWCGEPIGGEGQAPHICQDCVEAFWREDEP